MTQDTKDVVARLRREGSSTLVYGEQIIRSRELANEAADLIQSLSDRIDVLEAQRDLWRAEFKVLCDLVDQHKTRAALHQEHGSGE